MISRKIATLFLVCTLTMALNVTLVDASPGVSFYTYGNAIAAWSPQPKISGDYSAKLYVKDGAHDWAEVSIPIDIAIEDISEIRFYQFIESYSPNGWAVNVAFGVDCDGDGFESDVAGWQVVQTLDPAMLGDDSFIQMDGTPGPNPPIGSWNPVDAFNTPQWYTPNVAGNAYELFYGTLGNFISSLPVGRVEAGDRVKVLKLLIGGSLNWKEETAYVDNVVINGMTVLDDPPPIVVSIDIKPGSWPNPINTVSKGVSAVAICGTEDFDVTTIDPATVKIYIEGIEEGVAPLRWSYQDVATPYTGEPEGGHDLEGDGYLDLVLHFDTQAVVTTLTLSGHVGETIPLIIKGNLYVGGIPIQGRDYVWILQSKGKGP